MYWIEVAVSGRLAIVPRPRGEDWLEDEIGGWKAEGFDAVGCLMEQPELIELGLEREAALCRNVGIELIGFPIADRGVPQSIAAAKTLTREIAAKLRSGKTVGVHCRAGIGRSGLVAAATLVVLGHSAAGAWERVSRARGLRVPDTEEQRQWVIQFGAELSTDGQVC